MNIRLAVSGFILVLIIVSLAIAISKWGGSIDLKTSESYVTRQLGVITPPPTIGPAPFEKAGGRIITEEQLNAFLERNNIKLCLPSWIPANLSLTAIWALVYDGTIHFPVVFVFSPDGDTYYRASRNKLIVALKGFSATLSERRENAFGMSTVDLFRYYIQRGGISVYDRSGNLIGVIIQGGRKGISWAIVDIGGVEYHLYYRDADTLKAIIKSMCSGTV